MRRFPHAKPLVALATAIIVGAVATSSAVARCDGLSAARAELMRLHVRLTRAAMADPDLLAARDAASKACAEVYQLRQNAIAKVAQTQDYADLRLALWGKQKQLEGLYVEIPARVQAIVGGAKDAMSIRAKLTQLESAALEADDAYVEARDAANQKLAAYQKAQRDALDSIRNDPSFAAATQRVQAMQRAITGFRNTTIASAQ